MLECSSDVSFAYITLSHCTGQYFLFGAILFYQNFSSESKNRTDYIYLLHFLTNEDIK